MTTQKDITDALSTAIQTVSQKNVKDKEATLIIEAQVVDIIEEKTTDGETVNVYRMSYMGTYFPAYSVCPDFVYNINEMLYVIVQNGNFDAPKIILCPVKLRSDILHIDIPPIPPTPESKTWVIEAQITDIEDVETGEYQIEYLDDNYPAQAICPNFIFKNGEYVYVLLTEGELEDEMIILCPSIPRSDLLHVPAENIVHGVVSGVAEAESGTYNVQIDTEQGPQEYEVQSLFPELEYKEQDEIEVLVPDGDYDNTKTILSTGKLNIKTLSSVEDIVFEDTGKTLKETIIELANAQNDMINSARGVIGVRGLVTLDWEPTPEPEYPDSFVSMGGASDDPNGVSFIPIGENEDTQSGIISTS